MKDAPIWLVECVNRGRFQPKCAATLMSSRLPPSEPGRCEHRHRGAGAQTDRPDRAVRQLFSLCLRVSVRRFFF